MVKEKMKTIRLELKVCPFLERSINVKTDRIFLIIQSEIRFESARTFLRYSSTLLLSWSFLHFPNTLSTYSFKVLGHSSFLIPTPPTRGDDDEEALLLPIMVDAPTGVYCTLEDAPYRD